MSPTNNHKAGPGSAGAPCPALTFVALLYWYSAHDSDAEIRGIRRERQIVESR